MCFLLYQVILNLLSCSLLLYYHYFCYHLTILGSSASSSSTTTTKITTTTTIITTTNALTLIDSKIYSTECSICLYETDLISRTKDSETGVTNCGHCFHRSCWTTWSAQHFKRPQCPVCKIDVQVFRGVHFRLNYRWTYPKKFHDCENCRHRFGCYDNCLDEDECRCIYCDQCVLKTLCLDN